MRRLSVTARIALLAIVLALISNLALVGFVWKQTHDTTIDSVRHETIEQSDALLAVYRTGGFAALQSAIENARAPGDHALFVAVMDGNGRRVAGFGPSRLTIAPLASTGFHVAAIGTHSPWSRREAGYVLRPIGRYWLLSGRLLDLVEEEQRAIERALAVAILLSLALGIAGGLVITRYVGRRLDAIAAVVERAGEGDLTRRVPLVAGGGDAFDRLAAQLNAMLGKLERLMAELRVVTDSLAHDLRSPLARLRTRTENALLLSDGAQRDAALAGLLVETDFVMRMLSTLMEISRAEAVTRDRFAQTAPAEIVGEIGEFYAPVFEEAGLAFSVVLDDQPAAMPLHRELISQAVSNLIDNAIRHASGGGAVMLRLSESAGEVAIQVEDHGPGIPAEDRARALKRFGRLDSARTTPGAGLGTALVEAVARLHGGRFELGDNMPGLIARIVLPVP